MQNQSVIVNGDLYFKIRFNTAYGTTNLYWRVIIEENEYLVCAIKCDVPTFSESSWDAKANAMKWHMAGRCSEFAVDGDGCGVLK
jgi:hypothetical protein